MLTESTMHLPRFAIPVSGMLALICASAALADRKSVV